MVVTALQANARAPGNVIIELDGSRFASLPRDVIAALHLEVGEELDVAKHRRLSHLADAEAAYNRAVRMLTARPRAINDLLRRLRAKGHNPSAASEAVGRLEAAGLLDDAVFAEHFTRARSARGHGRARILSDLLSQGVERLLAERAIDKVLADEGVDPLDQVRKLAEKRGIQLRHLAPGAKKRRILGYLERRGFVGWEVRRVVEEVVGGEGSDA